MCIRDSFSPNKDKITKNDPKPTDFQVGKLLHHYSKAEVTSDITQRSHSVHAQELQKKAVQFEKDGKEIVQLQRTRNRKK